MIDEKLFVGGKDRWVADLDRDISASALKACAELEKIKVTIR